MKGIILAWGSGTRLYPITKAISKQLMPIYDKPMIYYPLSTLLLAWIKDILIITTPHDNESFKNLFWDGKKWWINIQYAVQPSPDWLAQAFIIWKDFIWDDDVCLILWDNLLHGHGLTWLLTNAIESVQKEKKSVVFAYEVENPESYWVVDFDENKNALSIEEKPENPKSNFAVVWLYFYTNDVIQIAQWVKPSERWELEITSVNEEFLNQWDLKIELLHRWYAWIDTGTTWNMLEASNFVKIIEERQWLKIACPEEIVWRKWYISHDELKTLGEGLKKNSYGQYLLKLK